MLNMSGSLYYYFPMPQRRVIGFSWVIFLFKARRPFKTITRITKPVLEYPPFPREGFQTGELTRLVRIQIPIQNGTCPPPLIQKGSWKIMVVKCKKSSLLVFRAINRMMRAIWYYNKVGKSNEDKETCNILSILFSNTRQLLTDTIDEKFKT